MPKDLVASSFSELLDDIARRTPTPGGGSVAAAAGALSAAMARMVAAYSIGKKSTEGDRQSMEVVQQKLARADAMLRTLVTQDAEAYTRLSEAMKEARNDEWKAGVYQQALLAAIAVPMEMAGVVSGLLDVLDEAKDRCNRHLISDLGVAAVLAEAAAQAAGYSVRINAIQLTDAAARERVLAEIEQIGARCDESAKRIKSFVDGVMHDSA